MDATLAFWISQLRKEFVAYCDHQLHLIGLSQGLLYFLICVGKRPGCTPGEVAAILKADSGHTTRSLEKLEQSGFITRKRRETDKRAYELHLTEKGENAFERSHELFAEWDAETTRGMPPEELEALIATLRRLSSFKPK